MATASKYPAMVQINEHLDFRDTSICDTVLTKVNNWRVIINRCLGANNGSKCNWKKVEQCFLTSSKWLHCRLHLLLRIKLHPSPCHASSFRACSFRDITCPCQVSILFAIVINKSSHCFEDGFEERSGSLFRRMEDLCLHSSNVNTHVKHIARCYRAVFRVWSRG
jgi:hypothetical protein